MMLAREGHEGEQCRPRRRPSAAPASRTGAAVRRPHGATGDSPPAAGVSCTKAMWIATATFWHAAAGPTSRGAECRRPVIGLPANLLHVEHCPTSAWGILRAEERLRVGEAGETRPATLRSLHPVRHRALSQDERCAGRLALFAVHEREEAKPGSQQRRTACRRDPISLRSAWRVHRGEPPMTMPRSAFGAAARPAERGPRQARRLPGFQSARQSTSDRSVAANGDTRKSPNRTQSRT